MNSDPHDQIPLLAIKHLKVFSPSSPWTSFHCELPRLQRQKKLPRCFRYGSFVSGSRSCTQVALVLTQSDNVWQCLPLTLPLQSLLLSHRGFWEEEKTNTVPVMTVARRRRRGSASESGIGGGKRKTGGDTWKNVFWKLMDQLKRPSLWQILPNPGRETPPPPLPPSQRPPGGARRRSRPPLNDLIWPRLPVMNGPAGGGTRRRERRLSGRPASTRSRAEEEREKSERDHYCFWHVQMDVALICHQIRGAGPRCRSWPRRHACGT